MGMWQWQRHRSAPSGALFVAASTLVAASACGTVLAVATARAARGLPSATVGLPRGSFERPSPARAAYDGALFALGERETPLGTAAAAHRWRVFDRRAPDEPLCAGVAEDALALAPLDATRAPPAVATPALRFLLRVPVPDTAFASYGPFPVPPRLFATCASLSELRARGEPTFSESALAYAEEVAPPGAALHVAACARALSRDESPPLDHPPALQFSLSNCPDGTPARAYPHEVPLQARARLRAVVVRAAWGSVLFSLVCVALGLRALGRASRDPA